MEDTQLSESTQPQELNLDNPATQQPREPVTQQPEQPEEPTTQQPQEPKAGHLDDLFKIMSSDLRVGHFLAEILAGSPVEKAAKFLQSATETVKEKVHQVQDHLSFLEQPRVPGSYDTHDDQEKRDVTRDVLRHRRHSIWQ